MNMLDTITEFEKCFEGINDSLSWDGKSIQNENSQPSKSNQAQSQSLSFQYYHCCSNASYSWHLEFGAPRAQASDFFSSVSWLIPR